MVRDEQNDAKFGTAFCVPIEAKQGITTGISASDRARTILTAIDPRPQPEDLARPGHIFPLRAEDGGVLMRAGQTEAAVDLARLAGLDPAGVICEIMNEDGTMARVPAARRVLRRARAAHDHDQDLIQHRLRNERLVRKVAEASLPTDYGDFRIHAFESPIDRRAARGAGDGRDRSRARACWCACTRSASPATSSRRRAAIAARSSHRRSKRSATRPGRAPVPPPGRPRHRPAEQAHAYQLQDQGRDTVEANEDLGFRADQRDYGIGAQILADLGLREIRLMTNNPRKFVGLDGYGLRIAGRVPIEVAPSAANVVYLKTKKEKLGHLLRKV